MIPVSPRGCLVVRPTGFRRSISIANRIDADLPRSAVFEMLIFSPQGVGVQPLQTGPIPRLDGGVWLEVRSGLPPFGDRYAVTAGVIESFAAQTAATSEVSASLRNVLLRQVAFVDGGSVISEDGGCVELEDVTFDTRSSAVNCEFASQCGAAGTRSCNPTTGQCAPPCMYGPQDAGFACEPQIGGVGALFETCDFSTPCRAGFTCVPRANRGRCYRAGVLALGNRTCERTDVTDTCAEGSYCLSLPAMGIVFPKECAKVCDEYAANPSCAAGEKCVLHTCMAQVSGDPAVLGAACANGNLSQVCAGNATTFLGRCSTFGVDGGPAVPGVGMTQSRCLPRCRTQQDCTGGTSCRVDSSIGTGMSVCF